MPWFVKIEQGIVEKPVFDQYVPAHRAYKKYPENPVTLVQGWKGMAGFILPIRYTNCTNVWQVCYRETIRKLRILRNQVSSLTAVQMLKIINHNQY